MRHDYMKSMQIKPPSSRPIDEQIDEARMIDRARDGDCHAWRRLVHENVPIVHSCLRKMNVISQDIEDLVQDTLIQTCRSLHLFRGECKLSTWMGQIACNAAKTHYMRSKRRGINDTVSADDWIDAILVEPSTPEDELAANQLARELVAELTIVENELLRHRILDGESYKSLGEKFGCPIGTVRSRLHRLRQKAQSTLNRGHAAPNADNRGAGCRRRKIARHSATPTS